MIDARDKEELEGLVTESQGNTYELIGDNSISPTIRSRFVARIDSLFREQGAGKTLEIISTHVTTEADPRGISSRPGPRGLPIGVEVLGRFFWKGIDRATYGRKAVVFVSGRFDGVQFSGQAAGSYRTDPSRTIDELAASAIDAAAADLRSKLEEKAAQSASSTSPK